jgi:hypothetical protein
MCFVKSSFGSNGTFKKTNWKPSWYISVLKFKTKSLKHYDKQTKALVPHWCPSLIKGKLFWFLRYVKITPFWWWAPRWHYFLRLFWHFSFFVLKFENNNSKFENTAVISLKRFHVSFLKSAFGVPLRAPLPGRVTLSRIR